MSIGVTVQLPPKKKKRVVVWSPERVTLLQRHWDEGKTAGQIASILGEVTRNSVIGKAHRLNLAGRPSPIRRKNPGAVTIRTLGEGMCRWPVGDPKEADFRFCARMAYSGFPYCSEHVAQAYQPPSRRQGGDRRRAAPTAMRLPGREA